MKPQTINASSLPYKCGIIIPNYNCASFVLDAINSAVQQSYKNKRIIVIDDCSTDNSVALIENFIKDIKDVPIIFLKNEKNIGVSATRNLGILAAADCEMVAFLDADDYYHKEKITLSAAKMCEFPGVGIVYSDYHMYDESTGITKYEYKAPFSYKALLHYCLISTNSVFKREVFSKVGYFNENFKIGEDYLMYLKVATKYMIAHIPFPLFTYRTHGKNATLNITNEYWVENDKKIKQEFTNWLKRS